MNFPAVIDANLGEINKTNVLDNVNDRLMIPKLRETREPNNGEFLSLELAELCMRWEKTARKV